MASRLQVALALLAGIAIGAAGYAVLVTKRPAEGERSVTAERADESGLPEIPVSIGYVEAKSGRGYLVQIHNQSQKHLAVLVEIENKTMNEKRSGPLQLAPGQLVELGGTPDWIFVSEEVVTLKLDGHQIKTFQIP